MKYFDFVIEDEKKTFSEDAIIRITKKATEASRCFLDASIKVSEMIQSIVDEDEKLLFDAIFMNHAFDLVKEENPDAFEMLAEILTEG